MKKVSQSSINRRQFMSYSALGLAGLTILPSWAQDGVRIAPSDRVVLGFVGLGRQGLSDFRSFSACPGVQVAACCDVDTMKVERFQQRVKDWQRTRNMNERCDGYEFYEKMFERRDLDAIEVCTPDHWHALQCIHAAEAGFDIYVQKPLAYTITEGLAITKSVRRNKRVLQVGSQQRSSAEFKKAIELVQTGAIGSIEKIYARVGAPPTPLNLPEQRVPANLNWNLWMGPLNDPKVHYHPDLAPPISLNPVQNETLWGAWRWYRETGNGYTADWGAHMFDIANVAIGMDGLTPVEYYPAGINGAQYATMKYANGIVMTEQPYLDDNENAQGIKFFGTRGWIEVARGYLACSDSSKVPANLAGNRPMTPAQRQAQQQQQQGQPRVIQQSQQDSAAEVSPPHMQNFIDCVRSRENPIAPVEVGESTNTLCCLANIALELNRVVRWDPATNSFGKDKEAEAHRLYYYQYRNPYNLGCWV